MTSEIKIHSVQVGKVMIVLQNSETLCLQDLDADTEEGVCVNFDALAKVMKMFAKERK